MTAQDMIISLYANKSNITEVNGVPVTIDDFKADLDNIPSDVWSYVSRELTVAAGLTSSQEATVNEILAKISGVLDANIVEVNEVPVTIDDFKASEVDLSSVINAINALNNISVTLAKEATLSSIALLIGNIPTTDSVTDIQPVLNALSALNDITALEVRAAFDETEFKDKNTELEIHSWLDTYTNKNDYKGLSEEQNIKLTSVLADTTNIKSVLDTLPTLLDIENSSVIAKKEDITVVEAIVNSLPSLANIRNEMINVTFGALEISNNQLTIKDKTGSVIAIFDLFDRIGNPTMTSVFRREVVL